MSRCFPFIPTGYAGKCSSNDALIYSIKLQEPKENSIPDRAIEKAKSSDKKKDRKKEKKEKKKDHKHKKRDEKEKLHSAVESVQQKPNDKLYKVDTLEKELKGKRSFEVLERSNLTVEKESKGKQSLDGLERSNLTEEHGRPVDSQNVSCSSDSTGNSSKRQKHHSSPANSIQGNGNIIRIRLSSKKKDDPSTSCSIPPPKTEDQTTSKADLRPLSMSDSAINVPTKEPSTSTVKLQSVPREDNLRICQDRKIEPLASSQDPSTSGRIESKEQPPKKLSSRDKKMLKKVTLYNNLFQNLAPPMLRTELVTVQDDDEDWLFGKKDEERPAKKLRGGDDVQACMDYLLCSGSAALQPRAHFLSDVGVYALPFTVPF